MAALSAREREVLAHLIEGLTESQIAPKLGISFHTVHAHVKAIYKHLQVRSRGQLLALWIRNFTRARKGRSLAVRRTSARSLPRSKTPRKRRGQVCAHAGNGQRA